MKVILTPYEIFLAANVGLRRAISKMQSKENNYINNKSYGWHTDIEGACAEMAFAKYKNWYWDGSVGTYRKPDVADVQVRHTEHDDGKLILRPNKTNENEIYVLVTGKAPAYFIRGGIKGADGMVEKYIFKGFNDMPDCWMVPQSDLIEI